MHQFSARISIIGRNGIMAKWFVIFLVHFNFNFSDYVKSKLFTRKKIDCKISETIEIIKDEKASVLGRL